MFPDPQSFRIKLEDLRDEKIRTRPRRWPQIRTGRVLLGDALRYR
jgi:hypothetical protein